MNLFEPPTNEELLDRKRTSRKLRLKQCYKDYLIAPDRKEQSYLQWRRSRRKLLSNYTLTAAEDLRMAHGLRLEEEMLEVIERICGKGISDS